MQSREFDELMDGKAAKMAFFTDMSNDTTGLMGKLLAAQTPGATQVQIDEAREEIKNKEVEIPGPLRFKIDIFIQQQREKGIKERTIRRMVQKKFNITVV